MCEPLAMLSCLGTLGLLCFIYLLFLVLGLWFGGNDTARASRSEDSLGDLRVCTKAR